MDSDGSSKNQWQNWQEWQKDSTPATVEPELNEKAERDRVKDFQTRIKPQEDWQSPKKRQLEDVTVEPQKRQKTRWHGLLQPSFVLVYICLHIYIIHSYYESICNCIDFDTDFDTQLIHCTF